MSLGLYRREALYGARHRGDGATRPPNRSRDRVPRLASTTRNPSLFFSFFFSESSLSIRRSFGRELYKYTSISFSFSKVKQKGFPFQERLERERKKASSGGESLVVVVARVFPYFSTHPATERERVKSWNPIARRRGDTQHCTAHIYTSHSFSLFFFVLESLVEKVTSRCIGAQQDTHISLFFFSLSFPLSTHLSLFPVSQQSHQTHRLTFAISSACIWCFSPALVA